MPKKKGKKQTDKTSGSTGEAEGADGKQANLSEEVLQDFWQGTTDEEAVKLDQQLVAEMKILMEHIEPGARVFVRFTTHTLEEDEDDDKYYLLQLNGKSLAVTSSEILKANDFEVATSGDITVTFVKDVLIAEKWFPLKLLFMLYEKSTNSIAGFRDGVLTNALARFMCTSDPQDFFRGMPPNVTDDILENADGPAHKALQADMGSITEYYKEIARCAIRKSKGESLDSKETNVDTNHKDTQSYEEKLMNLAKNFGKGGNNDCSKAFKRVHPEFANASLSGSAPLPQMLKALQFLCQREVAPGDAPTQDALTRTMLASLHGTHIGRTIISDASSAEAGGAADVTGGDGSGLFGGLSEFLQEDPLNANAEVKLDDTEISGLTAASTTVHQITSDPERLLNSEQRAFSAAFASEDGSLWNNGIVQVGTNFGLHLAVANVQSRVAAKFLEMFLDGELMWNGKQMNATLSDSVLQQAKLASAANAKRHASYGTSLNHPLVQYLHASKVDTSGIKAFLQLDRALRQYKNLSEPRNSGAVSAVHGFQISKEDMPSEYVRNFIKLCNNLRRTSTSIFPTQAYPAGLGDRAVAQHLYEELCRVRACQSTWRILSTDVVMLDGLIGTLDEMIDSFKDACADRAVDNSELDVFARKLIIAIQTGTDELTHRGAFIVNTTAAVRTARKMVTAKVAFQALGCTYSGNDAPSPDAGSALAAVSSPEAAVDVHPSANDENSGLLDEQHNIALYTSEGKSSMQDMTPMQRFMLDTLIVAKFMSSKGDANPFGKFHIRKLNADDNPIILPLRTNAPIWPLSPSMYTEFSAKYGPDMIKRILSRQKQMLQDADGIYNYGKTSNTSEPRQASLAQLRKICSAGPTPIRPSTVEVLDTYFGTTATAAARGTVNHATGDTPSPEDEPLPNATTTRRQELNKKRQAKRKAEKAELEALRAQANGTSGSQPQLQLSNGSGSSGNASATDANANPGASDGNATALDARLAKLEAQLLQQEGTAQRLRVKESLMQEGILPERAEAIADDLVGAPTETKS